MSRFELNLHDAHSCYMEDHSIAIETDTVQVLILLPKAWDVPSWGIKRPELTELFLEEEPSCNHPPVMHKLDGGCMAKNCPCENARMDVAHEKKGNNDTSN